MIGLSLKSVRNGETRESEIFGCGEAPRYAFLQRYEKKGVEVWGSANDVKRKGFGGRETR